MRRFLAVLLLLAIPIPSALADKAAEGDAFAIAAAHPLAAEAGRTMLAQGGSAVDAAIAAQMVLTLVEPQSSGIGGGAFLLHWDASARVAQAHDGRETAPRAATPTRFLGPDDAPMDFMAAVADGRSVGVPGLVRMLGNAHAAHGRLPWSRLFEPAIRLARDGFPVGERLHAMLETASRLKDDPAAGAYFFAADGAPWPVGHQLRNPALAETLAVLAEEGPDAFYAGSLVTDVVGAVRAAGGDLAPADFLSYRAPTRQPVCVSYRIWRVCGMGPPSSGGVAVGQILGLLERFDLAELDPNGAPAIHLLAEAGKLAFADRNRYVADADFVNVPVAGMLDRGYLARRSGLIDPERAMGPAAAGTPPGAPTTRAPDTAPGRPSTSHLVVRDSRGDAVSMTSSIEQAFGAGIMVRGFLLNNQLTDFSFRPERDGRPVANRVEPGKRPRSSMSPTLVFDGGSGDLVAATGSPGGSRIIGYTARSVLAMLDWGMGPAGAAALPHALNRNGPTELEAGTVLEDMRGRLTEMGHSVRVAPMISGIHALRVAPGGAIHVGADPRREGTALGDGGAR